MPISAISGTGTGELLDALVRGLPPPKGMEVEEQTDKPLAIAIVGRPNVGECTGRQLHQCICEFSLAEPITVAVTVTEMILIAKLGMFSPVLMKCFSSQIAGKWQNPKHHVHKHKARRLPHTTTGGSCLLLGG